LNFFSTDIGKARFPAGHHAIADLLHNLDDNDEEKCLDRKVLRDLPIQVKILIKGYEDAGTWSLVIYLTVRGKRLYVAHVIYHDR
jgi:hypothetical protein